MFWWVILLVFALPLINYLIELLTENKATNKKLENIQKRLKEKEKQKLKQDSLDLKPKNNKNN
jgi:uncharacterized membrane protein YhaH (DUF805 family)